MMAREVLDCFGEYRNFSSVDAWWEIEDVTGPLPDSYKEFCALYGPGVVGRFVKILHPESREADQYEAVEQMAPLYQELHPEKIPRAIYPCAGDGAVLWALSAQSDAFFLVLAGRGEWRIGVWFRQWAEWEEYADEVPTWLKRQVTGELEIPGIPLRRYGGFVGLE